MVWTSFFQVINLSVTAVPQLWNWLKPYAKASCHMTENHSVLVRKLATLRAKRDDLKNRATQYRSTMPDSMEDWFCREMDIRKRAQELEDKFRRKQTSKNIASRTKLSRRMERMSLEISDLIKEGKYLWDTLVVE